jgi:hypothetical protein
VNLFVLDARGELEIDPRDVSNPSPYLIELNVSTTNGVPIPNDAEKVVLRANGAFLSDLLVIAAPPPPPEVLKNVTISFHTNDDDKDDDTGVQVRIGTATEWHLEGKERFPDNSDRPKRMSPDQVKLSDVQGTPLTICISPNGNDTWRFNYVLSGDRGEGMRYLASAGNISLTEGHRCYSTILP